MIGLLTTPLPAQESSLLLIDQPDQAAPVIDPSTNRVDLADALRPFAETSRDDALKGETSLYLDQADYAAAPETLPLGDSEPSGAKGRGFHSVCECDCTIPPLDNWCDCCPPDCTTSCWGDHPCQCSHGNCYLLEDCRWVSNDAFCDVSRTRPYRSDAALRFGWWGVSTDGSPTKVGEYQDLKSSPFWDFDAITSDGVRTLDMTLSGLDNEASDARANYFGPAVSAKVDYQRYRRRLDHDPLTGYDLDNPVPPGPNDNVVSEDLDVGQDYAFRIQELDARFKGRLSDNLKWQLNLWGQRKFGERQTNATAHCFNINDPAPAGANGNVCHVVSQGQTVDWLTMEIQPVVEATFEDVTVEYSRTMRSFSQDDGIASRQYSRFNFNLPAPSGFVGPDYNYAIVPENLTQIDRLKIGAALTETNQLYANVFVGDTKNKFRDTHRDMRGYDLRLINSSFDQFKLTGYASRYDERNELPTTFFTAPPLAPANTYDQDSLRHPVDYTRTRAGIKGSWRPYGDRRSYDSYGWQDGTSLTGGYEYYQLERDFATYLTTPVPFTQPDTITHQIDLGPSTRWSPALDTFTRYRVRFIDVPLIGVSEYSEDDPDINGAFNSNLPEQVHSVDLGGTWTPADNFMATVQFTIENSWHQSQYANFTEDNYPIVFTLWLAPTSRLSLTAGYAYYSNWIDQDITLGANRGIPTDTETTRWNYAGTNQQVSLNANYAWSERVQLVGGYEWNRGSNTFNLPPSPNPGVDWTLLPFLSDVIVETNRVTAGVDWQPYRSMDVYCRYILFDYDDLSSGLDSGVSHMALAGAGVNW
jgi:hypothetical protein